MYFMSVRANRFHFPHQLRLLIATWSAMSGRIVGHNQVLPERVRWSISEVCFCLEKDSWWLACHPGSKQESRSILKQTEEFGICMASFEWWVIRALGTKVAILPSCHNTENPGLETHEDFLRTFTIKKIGGKVALSTYYVHPTYYNCFPYSGKENELKPLSVNI